MAENTGMIARRNRRMRRVALRFRRPEALNELAEIAFDGNRQILGDFALVEAEDEPRSATSTRVRDI